MSRQDVKREIDGPAELESHFVLRLPEEPAKVLRELLQTGGSLKDRCSIRLENDMRYGEVRVDHWLMHAKVIDLPTIVESLKTIDNKSFYKTADICQMMICKEEADQQPEEESPNKNKKKDPFKVEKKFLWPHGVTPPAKNIRKRRFRKTLKKKYVEAPEIEKEVKRLLRFDNDAVNVKWEVLSEEEEQAIKPEPNSGNNADEPMESIAVKEKIVKVKQEPKSVKQEYGPDESANADTSNVDVEHDIFGGAVSDSDEEMGSNINVELDDNSRLSEYDSRLTDSSSFQGEQMAHMKEGLPTQFASDMFSSGNKWMSSTSSTPTPFASRSGTPGSMSFHRTAAMSSPLADHYVDSYQPLSKESMQIKIEQISAELESLRQQRQKKEQEVANMENLALRQRFQDILENLNQEISDKEAELKDFQAAYQHSD